MNSCVISLSGSQRFHLSGLLKLLLWEGQSFWFGSVEVELEFAYRRSGLSGNDALIS